MNKGTIAVTIKKRGRTSTLKSNVPTETVKMTTDMDMNNAFISIHHY